MANLKIEAVAAASLVEDFDLYPRHKINSTNVKEIADAIESGVTLPPVRADQKSRRIVDGFHRRRAYLKALGPTAEMTVEFKDYPNDAQMFLDAVWLNAHHGQKLAPWDRARCIALAEGLSIDPAHLTAALSITKERYADLQINKIAMSPTAEIVPIKRTARHLHGQELSQTQLAGMLRSGGMSVGFYVEQVINAIEHDLVDTSNGALMERLSYLQEVLSHRRAA